MKLGNNEKEKKSAKGEQRKERQKISRFYQKGTKVQQKD